MNEHAKIQTKAVHGWNLRTKWRTIRKVIGGGRGARVGRAKYKKIFAQGKIKWKKIHVRQLTLKNIHAKA